MSLLITEAAEPITTAEVKAWAKIENSDEDSLVSSLITSCRREVESYTKQVLNNQTWQTVYPNDKAKTLFYSPRITVSAVTVDVNGTALTETTNYVLNKQLGRVKLLTQYSADEVITIEWDIVPTLSAQAALKQATLDLITYRFYNRGASDMPLLVQQVLNQYRVFCV